jgi:phage/conjugal plasmid C-4 type zinc finger TraR family protein
VRETDENWNWKEEVDDVNQSYTSSQPTTKAGQASKSNREQARALGQALSSWFAQQTRYRSQSELARALGLPFGTLRGYLMGIRVPSVENLLKLHEVTGLPEFAAAAAAAMSAPAGMVRPRAVPRPAPRPAASKSQQTLPEPGNFRPASVPSASYSSSSRSSDNGKDRNDEQKAERKKETSMSTPAANHLSAVPRPVQSQSPYTQASPQSPAPRSPSSERVAPPSARPVVPPPAERAAAPANTPVAHSPKSAPPPPLDRPSVPLQNGQKSSATSAPAHPAAPPAVAPPPGAQEQQSPAETPAPGERACADCGRPIPAERLAILPHATRCVQCQAIFERLRRRALAAQQPARRVDWSMLTEQ